MAPPAADRDELALDQIREVWRDPYDTGFAGDEYHAYRLTGGPLLTAATPGGLAAAIWTDWTAPDAGGGR